MTFLLVYHTCNTYYHYRFGGECPAHPKAQSPIILPWYNQGENQNIYVARQEDDHIGWVVCEYFSAINPALEYIEVDYDIWHLWEIYPTAEIMVTNGDEVGLPYISKNYDVVMKYYNQRIKDQTERFLGRLDWDKVKLDQQAQFIQGLRIARFQPLIGLKICLDAYDFDQWEINWGDPRTYWNAFKEILGVAKSIAP